MKYHPILTTAFLVCLAPLPAPAVLLYGTTVFGNLISFDSAAPGTLLSTMPITGLGGTSEAITAIDFRPSDGRLYGWGNAPGSIYRLYTINTATGLATRVPGNPDSTLTGATNWGFDFNPNADLIRIVGDNNLNLRMNPGTGLLSTDTALTPSSSVTAVAYDRNDLIPGTPTTLFGIDTTTDQLVRIGGVDSAPSPNGGAVTSIGLLGINALGVNGFDIGLDGIGYAGLSVGNPIPSSLYTINLTTGGATPVGQIGDGTDGIRALAAVVPEPSHTLLALFAGLALGFRRLR